MKKLLPFLSLFLASCATYHTHHSDDDGYYDAYDGQVAYINSYNYYPDRWGINYSSDYYSPYRYPPIGFYYNNCMSSIWGCYGHGYGSYNTWLSWSPWYYGGFVFSAWHRDDYWWYNHWRDRDHPHYGGRNSARREVARLADRQRERGYKARNQARHNNKPSRVSRERSRYNRPVRQHPRSLPNRSQQQRNRQPNRSQSPVNNRNQNSAVRSEPRLRSEDTWVSRDLNHQSRQYGSSQQWQRMQNESRVNDGSNSNNSDPKQFDRTNRMNKPTAVHRPNTRSAPVRSNPPKANRPRPKQSNQNQINRTNKNSSKTRQRSSNRSEKKSRN